MPAKVVGKKGKTKSSPTKSSVVDPSGLNSPPTGQDEVPKEGGGAAVPTDPTSATVEESPPAPLDHDLPSIRSDVFFNLKDNFLPPHGDSVRAICIDHRARRVYTAGYDDVVCIYAIESRERVGVLPHDDWVNGVAIMGISEESRLPPSLSSSALEESLAPSTSINLTYEASTLALPASPRREDVCLVVTGCEDGSITFWSPESLLVVHQLFPGPGPITSLSVTGDIVLANSLRSIFMVVGSTGTVVREFTGTSDQLCCISVGDQLLAGTGGGQVVCWDILGAAPLRESDAHGGLPVRCICPVEADNGTKDIISQSFATAGDDGYIALWSVSTGACLRRMPHFPTPISGPFKKPPCSIRAIAVHLRGKEAFLYAAGTDGRISCHALRAEKSGIVHSALGGCLAVTLGDITLVGGRPSQQPSFLVVGEMSGAVRALPIENSATNVLAGTCI
jgi:WD40 repeat protein